MKIIVGYPPNFDRIVARFPAARSPNVVFSWGDTIYSPGGEKLEMPTLKHEEAHGSRQKDNPETWWDRYLLEDEFRLIEEIVGHRAEYAAFSSMTRDRNRLAGYAFYVSSRLAGPLYGNLITQQEARKEISRGIQRN